MPTVSNTSPILNLAIIDHLDLLQAQFAHVIVPPDVLDELKPETDFPGTESIRQALQSGWLRVVELKDVRLSRALALELDRGEAAAIALALELGGSRRHQGPERLPHQVPVPPAVPEGSLARDQDR